MIRVTAYFFDDPGSPRDKAVQSIMEARNGVSVGAGTFLPTGERDVAYDFPTETDAEDARQALKKAGYHLQSAGQH